MKVEKTITDLRQRAEEAVRSQGSSEEELSSEEARRLVYELQVHQIELEMQNEELRQAQQQLAESRDRYVDLYDFAPVGFFTVSDKGLILEANLTGGDLLGVARDELIKRPFTHFVAKESQSGFYLHQRRVLQTETRQTCQLKMIKEDGTPFDARLESTTVLDSASPGPHLRTAIIDISEQVRAEAALRESNRHLEDTLAELEATQQRVLQQERLAAIGQLAAGIAHDFNNILTSVIGFAELLQDRENLSPGGQRNLAHIIQQGQRAAQLIRQILDFSRKSIVTKSPLDLLSFLQETIKLLERTIPENIDIVLEIESPDKRYVLNADPSQIQQVLTNLALNARDAMPEGGTFQVKLTTLTLQAGQPSPCSDMRPGDWIVLSVSDTGMGIAPSALPRVFEPFFTTKGVGEGAGLGLAQVYGIVQQHEGCLDVSSQVGEGTTFTLYFPTTSVTPKQAQSGSTETAVPLGHGETILLVEDESVVLEVMQDKLKTLEYQVLTATNGQEALDIYDFRRKDITLVLTDMMMPGMNGVTLSQALHKKNPAVKVIILTGYPLEDGETDGWQTYGILECLQKPLSLMELAQVVSRSLAL